MMGLKKVEKATTWKPVYNYPTYEVNEFGDIRNGLTKNPRKVYYDGNKEPFVMLYDRRFGRSIRVYLKDIK